MAAMIDSTAEARMFAQRPLLSSLLLLLLIRP